MEKTFRFRRVKERIRWDGEMNKYGMVNVEVGGWPIEVWDWKRKRWVGYQTELDGVEIFKALEFWKRHLESQRKLKRPNEVKNTIKAMHESGWKPDTWIEWASRKFCRTTVWRIRKAWGDHMKICARCRQRFPPYYVPRRRKRKI